MILDSVLEDPAVDSPQPPRDTPPYLAALYAIPLLTKDQEQHLFRKMNYLKYRADRLRQRIDPERPDVELSDRIEELPVEAL